MKASDRLELDDLRVQQRLLRREVDALEKRLDRLAFSVAIPEPVEISKPVTPEPPPLPAVVEKPAAAKSPEIFTPHPEPPAPSFEFRLGTFWLVRIGIVVLLTGLVFLGNYAYHHVVAQLGPLAKVLLLYLAGGTLAGAGLWLERGEEKMRNYARVLIAGGIAAIYYTTYAAHFVTKLRVIESPLLGGAALLALAGGIAWFADRRKSETIALLAILLSYYTAAINPVAGFSLFSNLLLTALAVFFLARNRWTNLSHLSLIATYASFAWWRFFQGGHLAIPSHLTPADFWAQSGFLLGYWTLFTVAVFLSRAEAFTQIQRTPFLTANNAAFFGLAAPAVGVVYPGSFGTFAALFGAALLALSLLARRVRPDDLFMDGAYLAQGLALGTVGLAAKFTGWQLALALAIESAVLLEMSRFRHGLLYRIAAALAAFGAAAIALGDFGKNRELVIPLGTALVLVFTASAWRFKQARGELAEPRWCWFPAGFVALALLVSLAVLRQWAGAANFPATLALAAVACAATLPLLRLPELAVLGQGFLFLANLTWFAAHRGSHPSAHLGILIASALALMHWWPRQRVLAPGDAIRPAIGLPYAAAAVAGLHAWVSPQFIGPAWMAASCALALLVLAYGLATRAWWLAAFSQIFTAIGVFEFFREIAAAPAWPLAFDARPLLAMLLLAAQAFAATRLAPRLPDLARPPVVLVAKIYRTVLAAMIFAWCAAYLPPAGQFCATMLFASAFFAAGILTHRPAAMLHAAAFALGGLAAVWARKFAHAEVFPADVAGTLLLLAAQQAARRWKLRAPLFPEEAHPAIIAAGLATLWLQVTHFAARSEHGLLLTLAWSLLAFAVLGGGFLLREKLYRHLALALFALAVGRVFVIDVWKFETIYRVLSFVVLGLALIVVGFAYNRLTPSHEPSKTTP